MKYLLELVLTTAIIFFVWNMLRRLFLPPPRENDPYKPSNPSRNQEKHGLNWDAEDAEFEEIKDEEKLKK